MVNNGNPDQTAPELAVWSDSALFAYAILLYKILGHVLYAIVFIILSIHPFVYLSIHVLASKFCIPYSA